MKSLDAVHVRFARLAGVVIALSLVAAGCIGPSEAGARNSKYGPVTEASPPSGEAQAPLQPLVQDEPHTCGLLAIAAVYRAYGQDPETLNLRFRLGTDRAAFLGKGPRDSTGTLHPDILRVLEQDGWLVEIVPDLPVGERASSLRSHLVNSPALALVALEPSNDMHWVALDSAAPGSVRVVDSLKEGVLEVPVASWLDERVLSLLLLSPRVDRSKGTFSAHKEGTIEMVRVLKRLKAL
ncbi:MAG: hypothetical protein AAF368_04150 [Planctomycetota bacterium]